MKTNINFVILTILFTHFTFGQESGSFEIKINRDNQNFELFPGETFTITSISGTVNKCPYVRKKKKGGVLGIGRRTVKIQVNNPHNPNNLPPSFILGNIRASGKIKLPENNIISYSLRNSELRNLISSKSTLKFEFNNEDGVVCPPGTGPSNGGYMVAYKIDSSQRFDLLEDYLDVSLNSKPITIEDIQNLDSQLFNRRLKKFNPTGLARLIFNHVQKNKNYTDIEKLDLYEKTVDHISSNYIPMLSELSKLASKYGRFDLSKKAADKVIAAMDDFNPKTYYTKDIVAKAFHFKARSLFEENFGLFSDDLVAANVAYLNAAVNYIDIGEKSKAIDCILKSSKALQKLKDETSLNLAMENVVKFRDSIKVLENRGWYFTDLEKDESLIVEEDLLITPLDITDNFELKDGTLIGKFEEFIILPGISLTFEDTDDYHSIQITAIRSAFGKNSKILAKGNDYPQDENNKANDGASFDDQRGPRQEKSGDPGNDGIKGRNGKNLELKTGIVFLESLEINTSGGQGQAGGNGGNGSLFFRTGQNNSNEHPPGEPGQPGIGGVGGDPGLISFSLYPIDTAISQKQKVDFENSIISKCKSGKLGKIGLFGFKGKSDRAELEDTRRPNSMENLSQKRRDFHTSRFNLSSQPIDTSKVNIKWIENDLEFSNLFSELRFKYDVKRMKDNPREK